MKILLTQYNSFLEFIISYVIYDQVEKKHQQLMRKNPADYENEQ